MHDHTMARRNREGRSASHAEPRSVDLDHRAALARLLGVPAYRWDGYELETQP